MALDILLKRVAMSRRFGRGNLQHLVADVGKNANEPKVYMNGHRLYKFEYIIDKDNNLKVKDSVFEQFTNKDISSPIYHYDIHNRYSGTIVPRMASIENLKYNDHRLTCDVLIHGNKMKVKKLIELFKENI